MLTPQQPTTRGRRHRSGFQCQRRPPHFAHSGCARARRGAAARLWAVEREDAERVARRVAQPRVAQVQLHAHGVLVFGAAQRPRAAQALHGRHARVVRPRLAPAPRARRRRRRWRGRAWRPARSVAWQAACAAFLTLNCVLRRMQGPTSPPPGTQATQLRCPEAPAASATGPRAWQRRARRAVCGRKALAPRGPRRRRTLCGPERQAGQGSTHGGRPRVHGPAVLTVHVGARSEAPPAQGLQPRVERLAARAEVRVRPARPPPGLAEVPVVGALAGAQARPLHGQVARCGTRGVRIPLRRTIVRVCDRQVLRTRTGPLHALVDRPRRSPGRARVAQRADGEVRALQARRGGAGQPVAEVARLARRHAVALAGRTRGCRRPHGGGARQAVCVKSATTAPLRPGLACVRTCVEQTTSSAASALRSMPSGCSAMSIVCGLRCTAAVSACASPTRGSLCSSAGRTSMPRPP